MTKTKWYEVEINRYGLLDRWKWQGSFRHVAQARRYAKNIGKELGCFARIVKADYSHYHLHQSLYQNIPKLTAEESQRLGSNPEWRRKDGILIDRGGGVYEVAVQHSIPPLIHRRTAIPTRRTKMKKHSKSKCPYLHVKKCPGCGRSCSCYRVSDDLLKNARLSLTGFEDADSCKPPAAQHSAPNPLV